jgi:two-component system, OmpR family, response regulator MprA
MSIVNIFKDRKILLLEDEEPLRRLIQMEFAYNHLQIEALPSFSGIVDYIQKLNPDLIILSLEVKSEESTGLLICEKLRFQGNKAWIIVTSSKSNINEKIAALNAGADDYFAKPFSSDELMAKVKAMLRRSFSVSNEGILEYSDIRMDLINRAVWRNNKLVDLRSKEFDLLKVFLLKPEQILTRAFIFDQVWGSSFLGDSNVIEVYIRYLRSKLEKPEIIKTKRGDGYILESDESRISKAASQTENNENLNF